MGETTPEVHIIPGDRQTADRKDTRAQVVLDLEVPRTHRVACCWVQEDRAKRWLTIDDGEVTSREDVAIRKNLYCFDLVVERRGERADEVSRTFVKCRQRWLQDLVIAGGISTALHILEVARRVDDTIALREVLHFSVAFSNTPIEVTRHAPVLTGSE